MWKGSYPSEFQSEWRAVPTTELVGWWWATFLMGWFISLFAGIVVTSLPIETVAAIRVLNLLTIAFVIFDILAAILLTFLVSEISSNQEKKRKRVNERVRAASS